MCLSHYCPASMVNDEGDEPPLSTVATLLLLNMGLFFPAG